MVSSNLMVEWVPLDRLSCNPANPRLNDDAVPHVAASLRRFGWQQPIVAKRSGEVIAGNTRLKAARALSMEKAPVVWFDGGDLEATAYSIADNRTHEFASWDLPALTHLLEELRKEDALDGVGYSDSEIDALLAELDANNNGVVEDPGPEAPPVDPVSRPGDLWYLGAHRLLCGDSTRKEDVARVLEGDVASLLATDPPYSVQYTGNDRPRDSGKDWSRVYHEVELRGLGSFLDLVFDACLPHLARCTAIYVWHSHVQQHDVAAAFERHGLLLHQVLVWVKPTGVLGHSFYQWRHEPCAFGWKRGEKPSHTNDTLTSVWEADWEGKQRIVGNEHPTQKPTCLFEIPMEQHTTAGAVVLEPFSGSGSQLIAAEKTRRRCRAIEISPAFVDVAIRRWEVTTGKSATLAADGNTFEAVRAARSSQ